MLSFYYLQGLDISDHSIPDSKPKGANGHRQIETVRQM